MARLTAICISFILVGLVFAGPVYAQIDPGTLLGAWLLDEGKGTVAADVSGNGNDGTLVGGPAWVAGQSGTALEFTGSGTYVDCGNAPALNVGVFSVSFWYNFPAAQSWNHMISRGQHVASGTPGSVNWGVMMYSGEQRILYETFNDTGWTGISANSTAGQWHHVVATFDGSTMQLYHDGQLAGSTGGGILLDESRPFLIGARSDAGSAGGFFTGSLDEVGYFSVVLTPEDVLTLMNEGLASVTGTVRPFARRPDPEDGAQHEATWISLGWTPGDLAVSHDVYVGKNFDEVNEGDPSAFQGNVTDAFILAGFFGYPFPDGLVPGTTYYWRIDEVNDADPNSPWKGDVWSFWIPPLNAYNESPSDAASFVPTDVTLSWGAGLDAKVHFVYFGDSFDDVNSAVVGTPSPATTFTPPGTLEFDKTYYWRVDESNPPNPTVKGDVWSFTTTLPGLGTAVMERWENITSTDINTLKNDVRFPNNPDVTETVNSFSWNGPDTDDYGARIEAWVYVPVTGDYTFWLNTDDQGELWLSTDDDPGNAVLIAQESSWAGFNTWGTGEEQSNPIPLIGGEKYYISALWKEGGGGDHCQVAWQGPGIPDRAVIAGTYLSPYEPLSAFGASPSNFAVGVTQAPNLQWKAGLNAASHEVYFGTDAAAVANATKASPEYVGSRQLGSESYEPPMLGWDTTYYWRVDEINTANPDSPWVGKVWSFTTADYGIVDDFEFYNDIPFGEPGSNLVYVAWKDGFDNPNANGSTIGYVTGASMEGNEVHGGLLSAPFQYNNTTAGVSEVVLNFTPAQDWTANGEMVLSLWFFGNPTNTPGQLYVKVNGVRVNYTGQASDLSRPIWQRWNIDLTTVGTNLQRVTSFAIGVQGSGATGTLLLDDITLHQSVPAPPVQIYLEAEAAAGITQPMTISSDPLASGGRYIGTQDGIGDENDNAPADGVATYNFTVQQDGVYKIELRVIITGGSNSFWVRIPTATSQTYEDPDQPGTGWIRFNDISDGADWHWDEVHSNDHGDAVVNITLPAGQHTLEIARREDGALLDAILITTDVD